MATSKISIGNVYKAGDTFTKYSGQLMCNGAVTGSTLKTLRFTIPLDKPIVASSVTVNTLTATVRGIRSTGGATFLNGDLTEYTLACSIVNGTIQVNLTSNTAFNVYGDSPISVQVNTLSVTFS